MKKILFNCSTNIQGGAVQNAANFIIESSKDNDFTYLYLVSKQVLQILESINFKSSRIILIKDSPSMRLSSRKNIKRYEHKFNPDLVFTMAGPSYIKFKTRHLMGCSNPYLIYASLKDIKYGRSYLEFIDRFLRTIYQKYYIKLADFYLFQTNISMMAFSKKFNINKNKLYYIPNALGIIKSEDENKKISSYQKNEFTNILCPFENFPHKGLHIIPQISKRLSSLGVKTKFNITISKKELTNKQITSFKHLDNINFIGRKLYSNMKLEYNKNDLVFLPSILEVFSSICIESLYFKKPLIISNKNFNYDILENYAVYCDSFSIDDCVEKILEASKLVDNDEYLTSAKSYIEKKFSNYEHRYYKIKEVFREILL